MTGCDENDCIELFKSIAGFSINGQSTRSKNRRDSNYRLTGLARIKNQEVDVSGSNDSKNCNARMAIKK